jgi:radical SAM protein (TIGR01212 family)
MTQNRPRYRSLSLWLKEYFGEPVRKITLDAGLGCPNRDGTLGSVGCIYCNPRGSGTGAHSEGISIGEQVDNGIEYLSRRFRCKKFIAYFQAFTNTYGLVEKLARLYGEALQRPEIVGLAIGTRPDYVPDPVLDLLEEAAQDRLVWIEYGLQSIHGTTLNRIRRGHGPDAFLDAVTRTRQRNIRVVAHMILGLPGESREDMIETARALADSGVWGVKLHPLYIVKGTHLDKMYREGQYSPLTEEDSLDLTLAVLQSLSPDIVIHRMTSDPHPAELSAPVWMLDRPGVRQRLERAMAERDFRQGAHHNSPFIG